MTAACRSFREALVAASEVELDRVCGRGESVGKDGELMRRDYVKRDYVSESISVGECSYVGIRERHSNILMATSMQEAEDDRDEEQSRYRGNHQTANDGAAQRRILFAALT